MSRAARDNRPRETCPCCAERALDSAASREVRSSSMASSGIDSTVWSVAGRGDHEALERYLAEGGDPDEEDPDEASGGGTPLFFAAMDDDTGPSTIRLLLAWGAKVDRMTRFGWTGLHAAAQTKSPRCVAALIAGGADVNLQKADFTGEYPLHEATKSSSEEEGSNAIECVRLLLAAGADPNARSKRLSSVRQDVTPLWCALVGDADRASRTIVCMLLRAGAKVLDGPKFAAKELPDPTIFPKQSGVRGVNYKEEIKCPSAWDKVHAIKAAKGWKRFAARHRIISGLLITRCVGDALPREVRALIGEFWAPLGGS